MYYKQKTNWTYSIYFNIYVTVGAKVVLLGNIEGPVWHLIIYYHLPIGC